MTTWLAIPPDGECKAFFYEPKNLGPEFRIIQVESADNQDIEFYENHSRIVQTFNPEERTS